MAYTVYCWGGRLSSRLSVYRGGTLVC